MHMLTAIINFCKKNRFLWALAKKAAYTMLALKAWLAVAYLNLWIKFGNNPGINTDTNSATPLIVSFTSYGHRILKSHITAASLLRQHLKPQKVVLWLAHGEKPSPKLEKLYARGLEIQYCDDLRSYKKLIPALQYYPDSIIVTADDDIIYPPNWLAKLYACHQDNPQAVCCHRGHQITKNDNNEVKPYNDWNWCITKNQNPFLIFPSGAGGILYPPQSLHKEVLNIAALKELAPYADDIWFKAMSLMQGTPCSIVQNKPMLIPASTPNTQAKSALRKINIDENQNDVQFKNVFVHYDLYKFLN